MQVNGNFPDEQLLAIADIQPVPWFANYVNYLVAKVIPPSFSYQQKKKKVSCTVEALLLGGAYFIQTLCRSSDKEKRTGRRNG